MHLCGPGWTSVDARDRLPELQALFERCAGFFEQEFGRPPRPDEAAQALLDGPPGKTPADKVFLLLLRDGATFGHVEVLRDFRRAREAYLGNFVLAPEARGQGLGKEVLAALEVALAAEGFDSLRLAATDQNVRGRRFWEAVGFTDDKVFPPRKLGERETVLHEYVKELTGLP
ncbi:MAG: GNAT family N-acetyltransferase [Anaeromyxobacteraceae bacterium]